MTQIDEFESLFKSAAKPVFEMEAVSFNRAMIVLDEKNEAADRLVDQLRQFLGVLNTLDSAIDVFVVDQSQYTGIGSLLDLIRSAGPDLICSYRNLQIPATEFPYSLGVYVDVITQATSIPILLFPRPELAQDQNLDLTHPRKVMAVTDHLAGDSHLVTYAAKFTENGGTLILTHVEDQKTFERYIETISKIPEIDTDVARETIMDQLLKEPRDYIESCRKGIKEAGLPITVDSIVTVGHHLSDYRNLIRDNQCNLLVLNTKDEDQLAMHGLAYPLSVELREIPMLLV